MRKFFSKLITFVANAIFGPWRVKALETELGNTRKELETARQTALDDQRANEHAKEEFLRHIGEAMNHMTKVAQYFGGTVQVDAVEANQFVLTVVDANRIDVASCVIGSNLNWIVVLVDRAGERPVQLPVQYGSDSDIVVTGLIASIHEHRTVV